MDGISAVAGYSRLEMRGHHTERCRKPMILGLPFFRPQAKIRRHLETEKLLLVSGQFWTAQVGEIGSLLRSYDVVLARQFVAHGASSDSYYFVRGLYSGGKVHH